MARLSSVLGGILAEFSRARLISDTMTKELVAEYENDPVMASFSVPRVTMRDVNLTLRFRVNGVEEHQPKSLSPQDMQSNWQALNPQKVLIKALGQAQVGAEDTQTIIGVLDQYNIAPMSEPTIMDVRRAQAGNMSSIVERATSPTVSIYTKLPVATRKRLGGKAKFSKTLNAAMGDVVNTVFAEKEKQNEIETALMSNIDISILGDELRESSGEVHEIQLTLHGEDIDLIQTDATDEEDR